MPREPFRRAARPTPVGTIGPTSTGPVPPAGPPPAGTSRPVRRARRSPCDAHRRVVLPSLRRVRVRAGPHRDAGPAVLPARPRAHARGPRPSDRGQAGRGGPRGLGSRLGGPVRRPPGRPRRGAFLPPSGQNRCAPGGRRRGSARHHPGDRAAGRRRAPGLPDGPGQRCELPDRDQHARGRRRGDGHGRGGGRRCGRRGRAGAGRRRRGDRGDGGRRVGRGRRVRRRRGVGGGRSGPGRTRGDARRASGPAGAGRSHHRGLPRAARGTGRLPGHPLRRPDQGGGRGLLVGDRVPPPLGHPARRPGRPRRAADRRAGRPLRGPGRVLPPAVRLHVAPGHGRPPAHDRPARPRRLGRRRLTSLAGHAALPGRLHGPRRPPGTQGTNSRTPAVSSVHDPFGPAPQRALRKDP
ncbi:hypothetical protein [Ornithinimicrobium kibberense]|uniref:hypothetical protein n=1 Tax=Ornithinimicrobium kibberense TaxID=282060 RepID=UPI003614076D